MSLLICYHALLGTGNFCISCSEDRIGYPGKPSSWTWRIPSSLLAFHAETRLNPIFTRKQDAHTFVSRGGEDADTWIVTTHAWADRHTGLHQRLDTRCAASTPMLTLLRMTWAHLQWPNENGVLMVRHVVNQVRMWDVLMSNMFMLVAVYRAARDGW
jgi:hypothetical protein